MKATASWPETRPRASGEENKGLLINLADLLDEHILFEFQHDRVQQAALAMMEEQQIA